MPSDWSKCWLGLPQSQWIVGLHDQWEFPPFSRGHWQSPCTALTTGSLPTINSQRLSRACMLNKLTIISSDNGLAPGRYQAIIWTNAGILLIGSLGRNFSEILIQIHTFSFKKIHLQISSGNSVLNMLRLCKGTVKKSTHDLFSYWQVFYMFLT